MSWITCSEHGHGRVAGERCRPIVVLGPVPTPIGLATNSPGTGAKPSVALRIGLVAGDQGGPAPPRNRSKQSNRNFAASHSTSFQPLFCNTPIIIPSHPSSLYKRLTLVTGSKLYRGPLFPFGYSSFQVFLFSLLHPLLPVFQGRRIHVENAYSGLGVVVFLFESLFVFDSA